MKTAQSFATAHLAFGGKPRKLGANDLVFYPSVVSFGVVVLRTGPI
jgi:hypothetical protein